MKTLIKVTNEDIENGVPFDGLRCPIALAFRRKFSKVINQFEDVVIGRCTSTVSINGSLVFFRLPKHAISFINRFDKTQTGIQFRFMAEVI